MTSHQWDVNKLTADKLFLSLMPDELGFLEERKSFSKKVTRGGLFCHAFEEEAEVKVLTNF
jgi:hypothetical protein